MKVPTIILTLLITITLIQCNTTSPEEKAALDTIIRGAEFFHTIGYKGGYVGIYSKDLSTHYGEAFYEEAKETEIWIQPPGTPSVGQTYLRVFLLTEDAKYLHYAEQAGKALAWGQRQVGGWNHLADLEQMDPQAEQITRVEGHGTFDDNISQGALTFLMNLDQFVDARWLTEAIELGLSFLLESQYENGGYPQWYPKVGREYYDYYTFNDRAINDCIRTLMIAYKYYEKPEYRNAALKGGDFILLTQGEPPQAGWAQQYDFSLQPAWARAFEPPAYCSFVTANNINTLIDLYLFSEDNRFLEPIPSAITWLTQSKLEESVWARLYEVGTNKPIYGDHDHEIHYTLEEISEERRNGYSWQGSYGIKQAIAYYELTKEKSVTQLQEMKETGLLPIQPQISLETLEKKVAEIEQKMDGEGRWVAEDDMIYAAEYVKNMDTLCTFIEKKRGVRLPIKPIR
jgi:PelA/Pel-15E family pectate lyase